MTELRYAELHCHSHYSFSDGADSPRQLAEEAARLGLSGLAITDHNGLYGVVQFHRAAREVGIPAVYGAELSVEADGERRGPPDPPGRHLTVLARDPEGYRRLSQTLTEAHLDGVKDQPVYTPERLAELAAGHWLVLTGCRKGAVPAALEAAGPAGARAELDRLVALFGRDNVAVELTHRDLPGDDDRVNVLAEIAADCGVIYVATNNVHYAAPARRRVAQALSAVRARTTLEEIDPWLPASGSAHLRSAAEMAARFHTRPEAVSQAADVAAECAFDLELLAPGLPDFPVPEGHTADTYLAARAAAGARRRYGPRHRERVVGSYAQIDRELAIIADMGFAGYFLIVADIVDFCHGKKIFCQGRGSAANSAVCYALGVTNVDSVSYKLVFARFLSPARDGPPDIDLDIESDRREEVIQYVYSAYGRDCAAQVANLVTYQPRSAVRDVAKALGYTPQQALDWSRRLDSRGEVADCEIAPLPPLVAELAEGFLDIPRHLGLHPGGMVICDQPVGRLCPVEWGRKPGRSVLQWDKEDCAAAGMVKFDLLGLGMLSALRRAVDLVADCHGDAVDLAALPLDDEDVYAMLCAADTVGVFQVESRAQMSTLPRLRPRNFYDLAVEVALIRPGPIQGGSVHPYLRRRAEQRRDDTADNWREATHPLLHPALERTYGVPLFQEQLMQIAVDVAGFTSADADALRRAIGAKKPHKAIAPLQERLYRGMRERGVSAAEADRVWKAMQGFADFGFPESHAVSFAHLVYSSAWLKCRYPAAFLAALLNAQPMGFYSPNTLIADAVRHGVQTRRPDVNDSAVETTLEPCPDAPEPPVYGVAALRLGLSQVRGLGKAAAQRIVAGQPYKDMHDVARRAQLNRAQLEVLADADAFACFSLDRRDATWVAGAAARQGRDTLAGSLPEVSAPALPGMSRVELAAADHRALGVSPDSHPMQFARAYLDSAGVLSLAETRRRAHNSRVWAAGLVTHRQRPGTAGGVTFLNMEDETGMLNVVCSPGLWKRYRVLARTAVALQIRGHVENRDNVVNLVADKLHPLELPQHIRRSRDFQ